MQLESVIAGTLSASSISKSFGVITVCSDVSLVVPPRARIGVVGPNGTGKSTLLRVLAGIEAPDEGRVRRDPPQLQVGYLPQEDDSRPGETLLESLARRTGVADAEADMRTFAAQMADDPRAATAYDDALETWLALGGADLESRAEALCTLVGLPADRLGVEAIALSAGQAARAALIAILLSRFGVLLLDEPTNNLDFAGLELLENFVPETPSAVVVVSHDRAFLDGCVTQIVELDGHSHTTREFTGNWSDYVAARELARTHQYVAHEQYRSEKERLTDRLRRQRAWSEQGAAAMRQKPLGDKFAQGFFLNRTEKQASKVRTTEKAIERLDKVDKPWEGWRLEMSLSAASRAGDLVARLEGAVVRRGTFVLGPFDLEIGWGERVAITGPNGSGKSTLLSTLLGRIDLDEGSRMLGPSVVVGELTQGRVRMDGPTLLDGFCDSTGLLPGQARNLLAKFGLGADDVLRPAHELSPGEATRTSLAALVAAQANCLVLDEPTNHLDLEAIEQLEQALQTYDGTLLVVTHDRRLLDAVQVDRRLEVSDGRVVSRSE